MGRSHSKPDIVYSVRTEFDTYKSPIQAQKFELGNSAKTVLETFLHSVKNFPQDNFIGSRSIHPDGLLGEYTWKKYLEVYSLSRKIGFVLRSYFPDENELNLLGIISKNREEWIIVEVACLFQNITTVCLADTLNLESFVFICKHCWLKVLFCSKPQLELILMSPDLFPSLKVVIVFDRTRSSVKAQGREYGIEILDYLDLPLEKITGSDRFPSPFSVYTISYTSGTTSEPKGVILTHENIISAMIGAELSKHYFSHKDIYIQYLPHSHIYDRIFCLMVINNGAKIGINSGDLNNLKDDLRTLRPTLLITVPSMLNRIYEVINQQFNSKSGLSKSMLDKALSQKIQKYEQTGELSNSFVQNLVFKKVQKSFGGNLRIMMCGSAPIAGEVMKFLRIVIGCPILEGYGLTETCGASFVTNAFDTGTEHIGGPLPGLEVKLKPVPDLGYTSNSHSEYGELLIRGPTIFQGYYLSSSHFFLTEDGWFETGDLVQRINDNGRFKIIDRLKNIIKLSSGEFVSVEKIERILLNSKMIQQIFVHGDSRESFLVAVVVVKKESIIQEMEKRKSFKVNLNRLIESGKLKKEVMDEIKMISSKFGLQSWEHVRNVFIEESEWTDQDLLTVTQKMIRYKALQKYKQVIEEMYWEVINNKS